MDRAVAIGTDRKGVVSKRAVLAVLLAGAFAAGLMLPTLLDFEHPVMSEAWVRGTVTALGMAGPLALIGLMVLAIVASLIPQRPHRGGSGGALWHTRGRGLRRDRRSSRCLRSLWCGTLSGTRCPARRSTYLVLKYIAAPRSQISLMLIVFGSRLIPFISFDAVS